MGNIVRPCSKGAVVPGATSGGSTGNGRTGRLSGELTRKADRSAQDGEGYVKSSAVAKAVASAGMGRGEQGSGGRGKAR